MPKDGPGAQKIELLGEHLVLNEFLDKACVLCFENHAIDTKHQIFQIQIQAFVGLQICLVMNITPEVDHPHITSFLLLICNT
jgi:hypothetical protein